MKKKRVPIPKKASTEYKIEIAVHPAESDGVNPTKKY